MNGSNPDSSIRAFAYRHDWDKDMQALQQGEAHKQQMAAERQRKTQYYGELIQAPTVVSPISQMKLDEHVKGVVTELGNFVAENPNFEEDIGLYSQFMNIRKKIIDNEIVRTDLKVQEELKLLEQNRTSLTKEEYEEERARHDSWANGDSQEPYFFNKFLVIQPIDLAAQIVQLVPEGTYEIDTVTGRKRITEKGNNEIKRLINDFLSVERNNIALQKHYEGLPAQTKSKFTDPEAYFYGLVKAMTARQEIGLSGGTGSGDSDGLEYIDLPGFEFLNKVERGNIPRTNPINSIHTIFGGAGNQLSLAEIQRNGTAFVANPKYDPKVEGSEPYIPLEYDTQYTSTSGGGDIIYDEDLGEYFVSMPFTALEAIDDSAYAESNLDNSIKSQLNATEAQEIIRKVRDIYGWTAAANPGITDDLGFNRIPAIAISGTMYLPLQPTRETIQMHNTTAFTKDKIPKSPQYKSQQRMIEISQQRDQLHRDTKTTKMTQPHPLDSNTPVELDFSAANTQVRYIPQINDYAIVMTVKAWNPRTLMVENQTFLVGENPATGKLSMALYNQ